MTRAELITQIRSKKSFLCVGLDTDIAKIPTFLLKHENPIVEFNKRIIDATKDYCVAYKINTAFYESRGAQGWKELEETLRYIPQNCFTIADAKRGDIGNTSKQYAKAFFETLSFDSLTVAPYMGDDSVRPFLEYKDKWVIVLGLTSNGGALDFQFLQDQHGKKVFEHVIEKCTQWGTKENLMFVVGATRSEDIAAARKSAPESFFLVPGVGAQGGSLKDIVQYGWNKECGLLVNSSRAIIYAGNDENFDTVAKVEAEKIQRQMIKILEEKKL